MAAKTKILSRYVGDRAFYKTALAVAIPIMIQMGITNFVSLLDNIMVGTLGTESISGVSIVSQFVFIFNLVVFGAVSAAGIFSAQFFGKEDTASIRNTFRFKILTNLTVGILCSVIFSVFSEALINAFLHEAEDGADLALAFSEAKNYLVYVIIGLIPFALSQAYASTLKETRHTIPPMIASIVAVATNLILNVILIFGIKDVIPAMGVAGAAIATSISRFVELLILIIWTHTNSERCPFIKGAYRSLHIPRELVYQICMKGLPLMANEILWACAVTVRTQCYSTRGMTSLAANSIATTVFNVFSVVYMAIGGSISILVGNKLGANDIDGAKDTARKMLAFSLLSAVTMSAVIFVSAPYLPHIFNITPDAKSLATYMLFVHAVFMPVYAFAHGAYFTIRSGGKMLITVLLDAGFMWALVVPFAKLITDLTPMGIYYLYPLIQGTEIIKCIISAVLLKKVKWARRLV